MQSPIHYQRLLEAVRARFAEPTWPDVQQWLETEATPARLRAGSFVPHNVEALRAASPPLLQPGDIIPTPLFATGESYEVPAHCQLGAGLHALGRVTVGEGVQIAGDVLAGETIRWRGGAQSCARNLAAPTIALEAAGLFEGGLWCDQMEAPDKGSHLPPGTRVQGVLVVDQPGDGPLLIGAGSQVGGIHVQGSLHSAENVTLSQVIASGDVEIGRNGRVGQITAARVAVQPGSHVALIQSQGEVTIAKKCVVDTVRTGGDIHLDATVSVLGHALLSERGTLRVAEGRGWHSKREHWFLLLPDDSLRPFTEGGERPAESRFLALRTLTHTLWQQSQRLAGEEG